MIDPTTGAVKAMWSYPSYDPNLVVDPDFDKAKAVLTLLQAAPGDPLLANAYQQRYMPGSTFKVLTTSIALQAGEVDPRLAVPENEHRVGAAADQRPDRELRRRTLRRRPHRGLHAELQHPLRPAGGRRRRGTRMVKGVADWGVGEPVPIDLPRPAASTFGSVVDPQQNIPLLAIRGFGQNEDQMVPLHMAMVGVHRRQRRADDEALRRRRRRSTTTATCSTAPTPSVWKTPITPETADDACRASCSASPSAARRAAASPSTTASRSPPRPGTAQLNGPGEPERSNAWIVAYAPADAPRYAVAVMLKGTNAEISSSTGGRLAGPIAKQVLDQAFAGETGG